MENKFEIIEDDFGYAVAELTQEEKSLLEKRLNLPVMEGDSIRLGAFMKLVIERNEDNPEYELFKKIMVKLSTIACFFA